MSRLDKGYLDPIRLKVCDDSRHERMAHDIHYFLAMTTPHGSMKGHCVACGKLIEFVECDMSFVLVSEVGREKGKKWRNRNPKALMNEQIVKTQYENARYAGLLGNVSRAPAGIAFELFRLEFLEGAK